MGYLAACSQLRREFYEDCKPKFRLLSKQIEKLHTDRKSGNFSLILPQSLELIVRPIGVIIGDFYRAICHFWKDKVKFSFTFASGIHPHSEDFFSSSNKPPSVPLSHGGLFSGVTLRQNPVSLYDSRSGSIFTSEQVALMQERAERNRLREKEMAALTPKCGDTDAMIWQVNPTASPSEGSPSSMG
jgi:hypothetical protein